MRLVKFLFVALTLQFFGNLQAQTPIGYVFDSGGDPIAGYFDPLDFSSYNELSYMYTSDGYEKGYYYDTEGNKIEGEIWFRSKRVRFRTDDKAQPIRLGPKDCSALVIGIDSFFVAHDFYYQQTKVLKDFVEEGFLKYNTTIGDDLWAIYYYFVANHGGILKTYLVKKAGSNEWVNTPERPKKFKEFAQKYFGGDAYVMKKVNDKEWNYSDMPGIIKRREYLLKLKAQKPIYFDEWWNEITDKEDAKYTAKIVSKVDSIWTIDYYSGNQKIYETQLAAFSPNVKEGTSKVFYPNGNIRKEINYEQNKIKHTKEYYKNGELHYYYEPVVKKNTYPEKRYISYLEVNDESGNSILDKKGNGEELFEDDIRGITLTRKYKKNKMTQSFYSAHDTTIYQLCDQGFLFNLKRLNKKLSKFLEEEHFNEAIHDNVQGTSIILAVIDTGGYMVDYKIEHTFYPQVDTLLADFVQSEMAVGALKGYRFKRYKANKEKQFYEVAIPFDFMLKLFYMDPKDVFIMPLHHMSFPVDTSPEITPPAFH